MKLFRIVACLLIFTLMMTFIAGCGKSKEEGPKEEGFMDDGSLLIATHDIKIDGKLDDWNNVKVLTIDTSFDGKELAYKHDVSLAWDGKDKLFVKGVIRQPEGQILAEQAKDSAEFYKDDVFEVFLIDSIPSDDTEHRTNCRHYALNSKYLFTAVDAYGYKLATNAEVKILPLENNEWSFEMAITLDEGLLKNINSDTEIYGKFAVELNSSQEFSLLGTTGGFWDTNNYLTIRFAK